MRKVFSQTTFFIILSHLLPLSVMSQNGHYWTQQYGAKSMLLSGSVIGGVEDLGAIYYNPGRLAQIDGKAFLLSADVFEYKKLKLNDPFGNNTSLAKNDFIGIPNIAAGTFEVPFLKSHTFGWAILTRNNTDLSFSYKNDIREDIYPDIPGEEFFGAEISLSNKTMEQWYAFTWAYNINNKLSIGLSNFLSIMNINKGNLTNLYVLEEETGRTAIFQDSKSIGINHTSLLWKFGLSYVREHAVYGLTVKTQHLSLNGEGSYNKEFVFSGLEGIHENPYQFTATHQRNLPVAYNSPWALGAGATFMLGTKYKIHISTEYFTKINHYTLLKANDYTSQSSGETFSFSYTDEHTDVMNWGLGLEMILNKTLSIYGSLSTDFAASKSDLASFIENENVMTSLGSRSDYYHYGGGFVLNFRKTEITFGTTYTGSKQHFPKAFNFPDGGNGTDFFASDSPSTLKWERWRFIVSFSVPFIKNVQKKIEEKIGIDPKLK